MYCCFDLDKQERHADQAVWYKLFSHTQQGIHKWTQLVYTCTCTVYIHFVYMNVSQSGKDKRFYTCVGKYVKSIDKAFQ